LREASVAESGVCAASVVAATRSVLEMRRIGRMEKDRSEEDCLVGEVRLDGWTPGEFPLGRLCQLSRLNR
jgi:hypothetical protein